jgi:hypothetical protein
MSSEGLSRVIQGIITGIGFPGAGSILKLNKERHIQGLLFTAFRTNMAALPAGSIQPWLIAHLMKIFNRRPALCAAPAAALCVIMRAAFDKNNPFRLDNNLRPFFAHDGLLSIFRPRVLGVEYVARQF